MAKIKSKTYECDGVEIKVNFNCSPKGVFSTNLNYVIQQKLNIDSARLEGNSLFEIEDVLDKAFILYKEANTSYTLKIGIIFGALGLFCKNSNGEFIKQFTGYQSPYLIQGSFIKPKNVIGFEFRVLIEENRDSKISLYETIHKDLRHGEVYSWTKQSGDYYSTTSSNERISDNEKIIDFNETTLNNLKAIQSQLQKASEFLVNLIDDENMESLLSAPNLKLLVSSDLKN